MRFKHQNQNVNVIERSVFSIVREVKYDRETSKERLKKVNRTRGKKRREVIAHTGETALIRNLV